MKVLNIKINDIKPYPDNPRNNDEKHDKEVTAMFEARGWTVLRIWECELKKKNESGE